MFCCCCCCCCILLFLLKKMYEKLIGMNWVYCCIIFFSCLILVNTLFIVWLSSKVFQNSLHDRLKSWPDSDSSINRCRAFVSKSWCFKMLGAQALRTKQVIIWFLICFCFSLFCYRKMTFFNASWIIYVVLLFFFFMHLDGLKNDGYSEVFINSVKSQLAIITNLTKKR